MIFDKTIEDKPCFFLIFSTILYKTLFILRVQRDIITDVHRSSCKVAITIVRLYLITRFFRHISAKSSNTKFRENPSNGSRVVPCGPTDLTKLTGVSRDVPTSPTRLSSSPTVQQMLHTLHSSTTDATVLASDWLLRWSTHFSTTVTCCDSPSKYSASHKFPWLT